MDDEVGDEVDVSVRERKQNFAEEMKGSNDGEEEERKGKENEKAASPVLMN